MNCIVLFHDLTLARHLLLASHVSNTHRDIPACRNTHWECDKSVAALERLPPSRTKKSNEFADLFQKILLNVKPFFSFSVTSKDFGWVTVLHLDLLLNWNGESHRPPDLQKKATQISKRSEQKNKGAEKNVLIWHYLKTKTHFDSIVTTIYKSFSYNCLYRGIQAVCGQKMG